MSVPEIKTHDNDRIGLVLSDVEYVLPASEWSEIIAALQSAIEHCSDEKKVSTQITDLLLKLPMNERLTLLIGKVSACCVAMSSSPEMALLNGKRVKDALEIVLSDAIQVRDAHDQFQSTET